MNPDTVMDIIIAVLFVLLILVGYRVFRDAVEEEDDMEHRMSQGMPFDPDYLRAIGADIDHEDDRDVQ